MKKGSFHIPTNISPDFQDLLKNIITWDSDKRYNMNQILNHTFFTGNKFSFCVPSNPANNNNIFLNKNNDNTKTLVSTPELVKTTEKKKILI